MPNTYERSLHEKAKQGDSQSQYEIGCRLIECYPMDCDRVKEAMKWFAEAANQEHQEAMFYLAALCSPADEIPYRVPRTSHDIQDIIKVHSDRPRDPQLSVRLYRKLAAAPTNCRISQNNLGTAYLNGLGVEESLNKDDRYEKAIEWFRKSAAQNYDVAMHNLGVCYDEIGKFSEAAKWYQEATDRGYMAAEYNLAIMYGMGRGVPEDRTKSKNMLRKLAKRRHLPAMAAMELFRKEGGGEKK